MSALNPAVPGRKNKLKKRHRRGMDKKTKIAKCTQDILKKKRTINWSWLFGFGYGQPALFFYPARGKRAILSFSPPCTEEGEKEKK